MEEAMRVLVIVGLWACLGSSIGARQGDGRFEDCYDRLLQEEIVGDTITLNMRDGTVIGGVYPVQIFSSSLYAHLTNSHGVISSLDIPLESINTITYTTRSTAGWAFAISGLAAGALGGALIGYNNAPEPEGWLDFPEIEYSVVGGILGGMLGGICGAEIGKHINLRVKLDCW
jgi:uncharacterized protein YcfJ